MVARLFLAGPGTGKTTTIINEIITLLEDSENTINGIIVCTFTRKATDELKTRLYSKLNYSKLKKINLLIGTIHSICFELLNKYTDGKYSDFNILSENNQFAFIHSKLENFGFDTDTIKKNGWKLSEDLVNIFNKITDERIDYLKLDYKGDEELEELCKLYPLYRRLLLKNKLLDFATIQSTFLEEFNDKKDFKDQIQNNFSHFFVDEYQDVNDLQNEIFLKLAYPSYFLTVVGDDDQSIYGFRGANIKNILELEQNLSRYGCKLLKTSLFKNYRSTKNLVNASNYIINNANYNRTTKQIVAARNIDGIKPIVIEFANDSDEAEYIANTILKMRKLKIINSFSMVGVLFRSAKNHSIKMQSVFKSYNIPFKLIGIGDFFESVLANEFLALLDLYLNKDENKFKIFHDRLVEIDELYSSNLINEYFTNNLFNDLEKFLLEKNNFGSCIGLAYELFIISKFIKRYDQDGENIGVLTDIILSYDEYVNGFNPYGLWSYLIYLKNTQKVDYIDNKNDDYVSLMTIHQSKGLEFNCVFLPSQNDRLKPANRLDRFFALIGQNDLLKDEERRIFYVGMTRSKDLLYISYSKNLENRNKQYAANLFVKELLSNKEIFISNINMKKVESKSFNIKGNENKEKVILSYNKIRLYNTCPLAYKYSNVWKLGTVRIGGLQFGSNLHRILEMLMRNIHKGIEINDQEVSRLFNLYWNSTNFRSEAENLKFMNSAKKQVEKFISILASKLHKENIFSIEDDFNIMINDNLVTGRFDLCLKFDKEYEIIDYKTGDFNDYSSQLSFYSVCFTQKYGIKNPKLSVFYLKEGRKIEIKARSQEIEISEISEITKKILNNSFPPKPGAYCKDCAYNRVCEFKFNPS